MQTPQSGSGWLTSIETRTRPTWVTMICSTTLLSGRTKQGPASSSTLWKRCSSLVDLLPRDLKINNWRYWWFCLNVLFAWKNETSMNMLASLWKMVWNWKKIGEWDFIFHVWMCVYFEWRTRTRDRKNKEDDEWKAINYNSLLKLS